MILYTVVPTHYVVSAEYLAREDVPELIEVSLGGRKLLVEPMGPTTGKVARVLSTNPADYLDPALQPGQIVEFISQHS